MIKKQIIFFLILFSVNKINSQENLFKELTNNTSISNPDVYTFEKYNINKSNSYVGKVDVTIPVYTIKTGDIEYPISFSYNTGGIKVDQLASDIGLGWSLSQTMITRTINSANDFNNRGYNSNDNEYVFANQEEQSNDFAYNIHRKTILGHFLRTKLSSSTLSKISSEKSNIDFLPDVYNFYSSKFSSKFFFPNVNTPIELSPQGIRIEAIKSKYTFATNFFINGGVSLYNFPTQDFFKIIITTPDGIKYTFNDCDLSAVFNKSNILSEYFIAPGHYSIPNPAQISAWHISEIEDLKTGKKIYFQYHTTHSNPFTQYTNLEIALKNGQRNFDYTHVSTLTEFPSTSSVPVQAYANGCKKYWAGQYSTVGSNGLTFQPLYNILETCRVDVQKKVLQKITFDDGEVSFFYNNNGLTQANISSIREDLYNGFFLSKVVVKNFKNQVVKEVELKHDYFVSDYNNGEFNPDNEFNSRRYKRLKLVELKESGKNSYKFSYNENIKLPPVNSFSVDFLGYYNGSNDITDKQALLSTKPKPKLYYYPNKLEKSLLPFPIPNNNNFTFLEGYFDRQANLYSKAWSMTKVEYPTGGYSEFEYETNDFKLENEDVLGGGLRIKKQILNDGYTSTNKEINYIYKDYDGKSSGNLDNFPFFGHPLAKFMDVSYSYNQGYDENIEPTVSLLYDYYNYKIADWKIFGKSNLLEDISSGSFIGYSRVIENEVGNGSVEKTFTSSSSDEFKNRIFRVTHGQDVEYDMASSIFGTLNTGLPMTCIKPFLLANSGIGANVFTDNSYKRGKLLFEKTYDSSGNLILEKQNIYQNFNYNHYIYYQAFLQPVQISGENNKMLTCASKKKYKIANYLPVESLTSSYDAFGNQVKIIKNHTYNDIGNIKTTIVNTLDNLIETKYFFPNDPEMISKPNVTELTNKNVKTIPLVTQTFKDYEKIIENEHIYKNWGNNLLAPEIIKTAKGNQPLENRVKYNVMDNTNGNPLEIQQEGGIKIVYIWGYNKTLPIAKIENAAYAEVQPFVSNLQTLSNGNNEQNLITALNNLRTALPNAMITTYTHKPLIGISTVTDPKSDTQTYHYDSFNRLQFVKDTQGNILSENEYHYKN